MRVISDNNVNSEIRVKEITLISLSLRNENPGWVPTHETDVICFTDSFHNGAADADALDTGPDTAVEHSHHRVGIRLCYDG